MIIKNPFIKERFWLVILLFFVGAAVYSNSLDNPFHYDDQFLIVNNTKIYDIERAGEFFTSVKQTETGAFPGYRPLVMASFSLNFYLDGLNPSGYRLVNLLFHILNSILVFFLLRGIIECLFKRRSSELKFLAASAAAVIFLVHPINTVLINFIWKRTDIFCSFFVLAGAVFFLYFMLPVYSDKSKDTVLRRLCSVLAINLFLIMGILSKEPAVLLPLAVAAVHMTCVRFDRLGRLAADMAPSLIIAASYAYVRIKFFASALRHESATIYASLDSTPGHIQYALSQVEVALRYLGLMIFPNGLNIYHDAHIPNSIFEIRTLSESILILALLLASAICFKKYRWISFGTIWFFLFLLPTSLAGRSFILMDEARAYMPLLGFIFILSVSALLLYDFLIERMGQKKALVSVSGITLTLIFFLAMNSFLRNNYYKTEASIWQDSVSKSPNAFLPRLYLGYVYMSEGDGEKALAEMQKAVELRPANPMARVYLGLVYQSIGANKRAAENYLEVLNKHPGHFHANQNMGVIYAESGDYLRALEHLSKAIKADESASIPYRETGYVYYKMKDAEKSLRYLQRAYELNPYDSLTLKRAGFVYLDLLNNSERARQSFARSLELDPDQPDLKKIMDY